LYFSPELQLLTWFYGMILEYSPLWQPAMGNTDSTWRYIIAMDYPRFTYILNVS